MVTDFLPDSMAWATVNPENRNVDATWSNGNAVITDTNYRRSDVDFCGLANMYAISVWTISWSINVDIVDVNVVAVLEHDMEALAVQQSNIADIPI